MSAKEITDLYRDKPKHPNLQLRLTVGLPISINHMYYNTSHGGKRLTAAAEDYVRVTRAYINAAIHDQGWKKANNSTWYYLDMIVYMPDRRKRDSHNMLKLLLDTMEGLTYQNDYYVMPNIKAVEYDAGNPHVEIILRPQTEKERTKAIKMFC